MDITIAYQQARQRIEEKYRNDLAKLEKSFEIFKEYGFIDGGNVKPILTSAQPSNSKIALIKSAIDMAHSPFTAPDIFKIVQNKYPEGKIDMKYISSILYRLRKDQIIEIVSQGKRRDGFKYKKKGH
jgi:hypothetical protein